uniref:Uncharacterized protein n=1 Tax=Anopheles melas TaxID=34690 RepID=A0A182TRD3_9DIPT
RNPPPPPTPVVVGGLEEDVGCSEPDEGEPIGPLPVLLSGSSSLMVSAVVEDTDEPPDEGGVLGSRGGDVFRLSCCRWGGIWSDGVEDDEEDSEDEDEDEDDEDEDDEEDGVGGARVGVEGVGGSSIAYTLCSSRDSECHLRPRIWLMAADSLSVHSATTFARISFMYSMNAFSGFFTWLRFFSRAASRSASD